LHLAPATRSSSDNGTFAIAGNCHAGIAFQDPGVITALQLS